MLRFPFVDMNITGFETLVIASPPKRKSSVTNQWSSKSLERNAKMIVEFYRDTIRHNRVLKIQNYFNEGPTSFSDVGL
jgi:hypothetical protein